MVDSAADGEVIDVRGDGRVILYKRPNLKNPKWQARIRVPNATKYKIVTTKTTNLREAERFALNLYEDLYMHVKAGGSVVTKTFQQVYDEWVKGTNPSQKRKDGVSYYALPYFGKMKIDKITDGEIVKFWEWRQKNPRKKGREVPLATIIREVPSIKPVFVYAKAKGYIKELPQLKPTTTQKVKLDARRPTFTTDVGERLSMRPMAGSMKQKRIHLFTATDTSPSTIFLS